MTTPENFPYEDLWYIRGIDHGDKNPLDKWGGYTEPDGSVRDFAAAEHVYPYEEVQKFPTDCWLVNGIQDYEHTTRWLLVFDVDIHKAPDDFDADRITIPTDTTVVKSQSGGLHVYSVIRTRPTRGKENDFEVVQELPGDFDIDIRGEFVKHHVVAPSDIPSVGGPYEIVEDKPLLHRKNPDDIAKRFKLDGEPILRYRPSGGIADNSNTFDRESVEPPENMPQCYGAGLELRAEAPENENLNTHKVNVLTALCGLAAGYSTDAVVSHFVDDYYPGEPGNADREKTTYQVNHLAEKLDSNHYSAPANLSLQAYGILPDGDWCDCDIPGHNGEPRVVNRSLGNEVYSEMETTDSMETVFDAVASVAPDDVDIDVPAGVQPHEEYGAWVLVDRSTVVDALQLVAFNEEVVEQVGDYPSGTAFWKALERLRERGANIPRYEDHDADLHALHESVEGEEERQKKAMKALKLS